MGVGVNGRHQRRGVYGVAQRHPLQPDLPTFEELGYKGFDAVQWYGIVGPAGIPKPVVDKLNAEIVDILKQKDVAEKLNQQGALPVGDTPEQFGAYIKAEIDKWGAVVRSANIKAD